MDMIHRLPFRDWLQLDEATPATVVEDPIAANSGEIANRSR